MFNRESFSEGRKSRSAIAYIKHSAVNSHESFVARTKPFTRGHTKVFVPFTILDTLLGDEPTFKGNELLVYGANALDRLHQPLV